MVFPGVGTGVVGVGTGDPPGEGIIVGPMVMIGVGSGVAGVGGGGVPFGEGAMVMVGVEVGVGTFAGTSNTACAVMTGGAPLGMFEVAIAT
jgi:hypothetical protein